MARMPLAAVSLFLSLQFACSGLSNAQFSPPFLGWTLSETHAWDSSSSLPMDPDVSRYIRNAPAPELPPPQRLPYFVRQLSSTNPEIAFDAFHEVTLAGVKHIPTLSPADLERLEGYILNRKQDQDNFPVGLDILIAGYLIAEGEKGLDVIDRSILTGKEFSFNTIYSAIQGVRYLWKQNDGSVEKERIRKSLRMLLDRPEIAEFIIPDLAKWEDWSIQDSLMKLYNATPLENNHLKRVIIGYLLQSTQKVPAEQTDDLPAHVVQGRKYLELLEESDPKIYREALRFNSPVRRKAVEEKQGRVDAQAGFDRVASGLSGIKISSSAIHNVVFAPEGKTLVSGSGNGSLDWWDIVSGKPIETIPAHSTWCFSIAFHPDGKEFATGGGDQLVKRWQVGKSEPIAALAEHTDDVHAVAYDPSGRFLFSTGDDMSVVAYDIQASKVTRTMKGHSEAIPCLAVSPDGSMIATGSRDDTIRLWNAVTGDTKHVLKGHTNDVHSVKFSPDGKILASASYDETVKLWNVETGDAIATLDGHTNWVFSVAFHPGGTRLASGDKDGRILIWDLNSRKEIAALKRQRHVSCVAFSPDGKLLASSSPEATICLWNWETKKLSSTMQPATPKQSQ